MQQESYLTPEQLENFRSRLRAWRRDLLEDAESTIEQLRSDVNREVGDEADRATVESDHAIELRVRDRQRKLLRKIDAALQRIEDGTYGYCEETGEPIGLARLEARPIATMSLEAQERYERRERHQADTR
jgi:DnaK suppressor protein